MNHKSNCKVCSREYKTVTLEKRNGICYLCEIKLNKKPSVKTVKKQTIPKRIKVECWNKYIGERFRAGSCYVCSTLIFDYNCHYAHVIPEAKGGIISVDNLRPTCALCNLSCGTKNLNDFKDAFIGNTSVPMEIEIDANLAYPIN